MPGDTFYASAKWRETRRLFLRAFPVCTVPGCGKRASHVDHVKSRRSGGSPFDWANLTGLCHGHHSSKTAQVDGGFGNRLGRIVRQVVRGCAADGTPLDPSHSWNGTTA